MASIASIKPGPEGKQCVFRFFISHTSEDKNIAIAVSNAIQTAVGPSAEVFIDSGLRFGDSFQDEIKKTLDTTNTLVVIDTPTLKPAYGFTGLELGYFMALMKSEAEPDFPRRIIPIYLEDISEILRPFEAVKIGISRSTLAMKQDEYEDSLEGIGYQNEAVRFLRDSQGLIDKFREKHGAERIPPSDDQRDLPAVVRKMQLAIFSHLKTTAEFTQTPQKQITLKTSDDALTSCDCEVPPDAQLIPAGNGNPMAIFGLPNVALEWESFQKQTQQAKFRDSWLDAITNIVSASLQNQLDADNSAVIVSHDGQRAYRVILSTATKYFNGVREFSLYFVEYLRRPEFGDRDTTLLFKGLELLCHFRSLFFERSSEFSSIAFDVANTKDVADKARKMEQELNLMHRDAMKLELDNPAAWFEFVDPTRLLKMAKAWQPLEPRIRGALTSIRRAAPSSVDSERQVLVTALRDMEAAIRPLNADAIAEMADKLKKPIAATAA